MNDSLAQNIQHGQGIPDAGVRLTVFVIAGFIVLVFIALLYFKMKDADRKTGF